MASASGGGHGDAGYDERFVVEPDADMFCPICLLVMRNPLQSATCGHTICKACHERYRDQASGSLKCHQCNQKRQDFFADCKERRRIESLHVHCRDEECKWTGELRYLEEHMEKVCQLPPIECPFSVIGCTQMMKESLIPPDPHNHLELTEELRLAKNKLEDELEELKRNATSRNKQKKEITKLKRQLDQQDKVHASAVEQNCVNIEAQRMENSQLKRSRDKLAEEHAHCGSVEQVQQLNIDEKKKEIAQLKRSHNEFAEEYAYCELVKQEQQWNIDEKKKEIAQLKRSHDQLVKEHAQLERSHNEFAEEHAQCESDIEEQTETISLLEVKLAQASQKSAKLFHLNQQLQDKVEEGERKHIHLQNWRNQHLARELQNQQRINNLVWSGERELQNAEYQREKSDIYAQRITKLGLFFCFVTCLIMFLPFYEYYFKYR